MIKMVKIDSTGLGIIYLSEGGDNNFTFQGHLAGFSQEIVAIQNDNLVKLYDEKRSNISTFTVIGQVIAVTNDGVTTEDEDWYFDYNKHGSPIKAYSYI
jgi:hypothetical protein